MTEVVARLQALIEQWRLDACLVERQGARIALQHADDLAAVLQGLAEPHPAPEIGVQAVEALYQKLADPPPPTWHPTCETPNTSSVPGAAIACRYRFQRQYDKWCRTCLIAALTRPDPPTGGRQEP